MATPTGWTRNEHGGYTHPKFGCIRRAEYILSNYSCWDWFWYPSQAADEVKHRQGPYPTLRAAAQAAERKS